MDQPLAPFDLDNERSAQPKYEQLRDYLARQMMSGRLKPGQRIPS
jgi:DNA-binding GntR family transcriptional regulator